jgi:hypothetical protein
MVNATVTACAQMAGGVRVVELEAVDDAGRWDALLAQMGFSPWQQSRAYGAALARGGRRVVRLGLDRGGDTVGVVQVVGSLALGGRCGVWHALGGPLWRPGLSAAAQCAALRALDHHLSGPLRRLLVTPALPPTRTGAALEGAGMRRVVTGFTTAVLPVAASSERQAARLRPGWRAALRRSFAAGTTVACREARADPHRLDAALALHEQERRRRGYAAVSAAVVAHAARRGPALLATATSEAGLDAFVLVFVHGATATYQVGWTTAAGRATCAHHRLLWTVLTELRDRGVRFLDLGGLNLPAGIVGFKLATGAVPRTFAGTYLAGAGLRARARCPSRESPANSRAGSSAGRLAPPSAARRSSACPAAPAG